MDRTLANAPFAGQEHTWPNLTKLNVTHHPPDTVKPKSKARRSRPKATAASGELAVKERIPVWKWKIAKLTADDLDFRPETIKDSELYECYQYEYTREISTLREAVDASRQQHRDYAEKFVSRMRQFLSSKPKPPLPLGEAFFANLNHASPPLAYRFDPSWPVLPFKRRSFHANARSANWTFRYFEQDFWDFVRKTKEGSNFTAIGKSLWAEKTKTEAVIFTIPWGYNDTQLVEGFKAWLAQRRPKGENGDPRGFVEQYREPTGAASDLRQRRAALKALAAWRLMVACNSNRHRAQTCIIPQFDLIKMLGKNFAHDATWKDAVMLALENIEHVFETAGRRYNLESVLQP